MLQESQVENLFKKLLDELFSVRFPAPEIEELEESFTARVLLPWLSNWVKSLQTPGLYVRGDGGASINPVRFHGANLYPDLSISAFEAYYVAIEVKYLRNEDAGGSLTKAVGQTFLYRHGGFAASFALIFDLRSREMKASSMQVTDCFQIAEKVYGLIFEPKLLEN